MKKQYLKRVVLLSFCMVSWVHASLVNEVKKNKQLLNEQMKDLPNVANQLLETGAMLHNQLITEVDKADTQLKEQGQLLVIPQSIFNDPFGELAKQDPNNKFLEFMRKPEFRAAYKALWEEVLGVAKASSLPDILNNLTQLLDLVGTKLTSIKGGFDPIVRDLHTYVVLKQAQKDIPGTKRIDFDFVKNNQLYVDAAYKKATGGQAFDPKGIYAGLDNALKDFDKALTELDKLEKLFKALGL